MHTFTFRQKTKCRRIDNIEADVVLKRRVYMRLRQMCHEVGLDYCDNGFVLIRKDNIIISLSCLLLFCHALLAPKIVAGEINDDTKQKVLNAIESLKHVRFPETGKGTALVKLQNNQGDFENVIDFAFKNEFSRSAIYHLKDGQQGSLKRGWALGPKGSSSYSDIGRNALIQSDKLSAFYRNRDTLNIDFHPDTFLKCSTTNKNYAEALKAILANNADVSVNFSNDNIMHINAYHESEDFILDVKFSLDILKGFLPIHIHDIQRHPNDPSKDKNHKFDLQWANYKGRYYITSFTHEYEVVTAPLNASDVKNMISGETISDELIELIHAKNRSEDAIHDKIKLEIVIDKFLPDVEINDHEFSLASFAVPLGTDVNDKIAGLQYKMGSAAKNSLYRVNLGDDIESVNRLADKVKSTVTAEESSLQKNTPLKQKSDQKTDGKTSLFKIVAIVAIVFLLIIGFYLFLKKNMTTKCASLIVFIYILSFFPGVPAKADVTLHENAFPSTPEFAGELPNVISVHRDLLCGPKCLWHIANACGIRFSLSEIEYVANTDREKGTTVKGMINALQEMGLTGIPVKIDISALEKESRVAIMLLRQEESSGHYVIYDKIENDRIRFFDDGTFKELSIDRLKQIWGGHTILVDTENGSHIGVSRNYIASTVQWSGILIFALLVMRLVKRKVYCSRNN